jgi:hypothetical protein
MATRVSGGHGGPTSELFLSPGFPPAEEGQGKPEPRLIEGPSFLPLTALCRVSLRG